MKPNTIALNILLSLASTLLCFLFLEAAARIYLVHFSSKSIFLKYASLQLLQERYDATSSLEGLKTQTRYLETKTRYLPHRYLGYFPTHNYSEGKNRHNSLGFRGDEIDMPKPRDEFRIVCMGGSTTYDGQIEDYKLSFTSLLEAKLKSKGYGKVKVINAAAGGWSSWELLINFELRILDLEPDMIILYTGHNDINARLVWPPEAYKGDNSGWRVPNHGLSMPSIFEYSTFLTALMIRTGLTQSHNDLARSFAKHSQTYYRDSFREQKIKGIYPQGIFKKTSAAKMLETNKPKYFARNIENIVIIAKQRGIKTLLASFAFSPLFEEPVASSEEYITATAEMNAEVQRIAKHYKVNFFDFNAVFPKDKKYFTDGVHVSIEGARLKAKLFADFIVLNRLVL
ncbi:MAG: SGNH/GDSL hydrolase family protein [Candidatus Hodarchaeota archaeon]